MARWKHSILPEIEAFIKERKWKPYKFGKLAAGNVLLVSRLRKGGDIGEKTTQRIRKFMEEYDG